MENSDKIEVWKADEATLIQIQELKKFVDFVANLEFATSEDKTNAEEIKYLIENIHDPKTHKAWSVCLDIFDPEIQLYNKEGIYWRKWDVFFEAECLDVEAESNHTSDALGHYGNDFCFYYNVCFSNDCNGKRIYKSDDISEFVKDAMNYKNYITESLNEVEVEIEVWGNKKTK